MALVTVTYQHDDCMGRCYNCGRPAAWEQDRGDHRFCGICAAHEFAGGDWLVWLFQEED